MQTLQSYIKRSEAFKAFARNRLACIEVEGLDGFPLFQCALLMAQSIDSVTWVICPTEEVAKVLYTNLDMAQGKSDSLPVFLLGTSGRVLYSPWEGSAKEYEQIRCLGGIASSQKAMVVTSIRAICSPVPKKSALDASSLHFKVGQEVDTMDVAERLTKGNYFRTSNTTMPGEFTIRGEVLDIFPYGAELPVRIYLDWDRIERICRFEPLSQQVTKTLGHVDMQIMGSSDSDSVVPGGISEYFSKGDYFIFVGDKRLESSYKSMQLEAKSLFRKAFQEN
ncbi:MAG: transcription-repair coupling factor, partial [Spirochaetales bacterium]|nr:transcription-repair coupling factor [Spirochaetales bacterium]